MRSPEELAEEIHHNAGFCTIEVLRNGNVLDFSTVLLDAIRAIDAEYSILTPEEFLSEDELNKIRNEAVAKRNVEILKVIDEIYKRLGTSYDECEILDELKQKLGLE